MRVVVAGQESAPTAARSSLFISKCAITCGSTIRMTQATHCNGFNEEPMRAWLQEPIRQEKNGPNSVGPMSADGRFRCMYSNDCRSAHPCLEREREAPLTDAKNGGRIGGMM